MKEIYQNATGVIVWLGLAAEGSCWGIALAKEMARLMESFELQSPVTTEMLLAKGAPELNSPAWMALAKIIRRPWFTRVWIVQEIVMGRKVDLYCGKSSIPWRELANVVTNMLRPSLSGLLWIPGTGTPSGVTQVVFMNRYREKVQQGILPHIETLLIAMLQSKATDARDKIWALLGIAETDDDIALIPNYERPEKEVFLATAKHLITKPPTSLESLSFAGASMSRAGCPSWVPAWTGQPNLTPFGFIAGAARYAVAGQTKPVVSQSADPKILSIRGKSVDTVMAIGSTCLAFKPTPDMSDEDFNNTFSTGELGWVEDASSLIRGESGRYPTGGSYYEAFWRTMVANVLLDGGRRPIPASKKHAAYFESWKQSLQLLKHGSQLTEPRMAHEAGVFAASKKQATSGRRFSLTSRGYLGLVPTETATEDVICILLGSKVPFVLSPKQSDISGTTVYSLIGDCYVHGIMTGEAMGDANLETREFHLG